MSHANRRLIFGDLIYPIVCYFESVKKFVGAAGIVATTTTSRGIFKITSVVTVNCKNFSIKTFLIYNMYCVAGGTQFLMISSFQLFATRYKDKLKNFKFCPSKIFSYRIGRKFGMELNLAVDDFLWRSPNLIHQLQIQWCFIIQCDP